MVPLTSSSSLKSYSHSLLTDFKPLLLFEFFLLQFIDVFLVAIYCLCLVLHMAKVIKTGVLNLQIFIIIRASGYSSSHHTAIWPTFACMLLSFLLLFVNSYSQIHYQHWSQQTQPAVGVYGHFLFTIQATLLPCLNLSHSCLQ